MEIMCSGCNREEARVFCCADEAALCLECDRKIHAATKLLSKHHRVSLSSASSSPRPKCDICQETVCHFFCLEDRALLCRKCDVAIHTVNSFVWGHQRFLLTGAKVVGPEPESTELGRSTDSDRILLGSNNKSAAMDDSLAACRPQAAESRRDGMTMSHGGSNAGIITGSKTKDILDLIDSNNDYPSSQDVLSKAEDGSSEWWKILRSTEEELLNTPDQYLDASWTVPELLRQYPHQGGLVSSRDKGGSSSLNNTVVNFSVSDAAGCPAGAAAAASQCHLNSNISTKRRRCKTSLLGQSS